MPKILQYWAIPA